MLQQIKQYIKALGQAYIPHQLYILDADVSNLVEDQLHDITYPAYIVESPEISISGDLDHADRQWTLGVGIIMNSDVGDIDRLEYNRTVTHTIADHIVAKIRADVQQRRCIWRTMRMREVRIDAVSVRTNDYCVGWRIEVVLTSTYATDISGVFAEVDDRVISFDYDANVAIAARDVLGDWEVWVDGESISTHETVNTIDLSNITAGKQVYITLSAGDKSASAKFVAGTAGQSIPLLYNPYK